MRAVGGEHAELALQYRASGRNADSGSVKTLALRLLVPRAVMLMVLRFVAPGECSRSFLHHRKYWPVLLPKVRYLPLPVQEWP
jgi:hypothetical protein